MSAHPYGSFERLSRNGIYSVADYLLPQIGLLIAAPLLLRYIGARQLGLWFLTITLTSAGVLVASAFGDAAIRYASVAQQRKQTAVLERVVRSTLAINLGFGALLASVIWLAAPAVSHHVTRLDPELQPVCTTCLRLGSILLVIRAQEALYISTLRALQCYAVAARISAGARLTGLLVSVLLAARHFGILSILCVTLLAAAISACALCISVRTHTGLLIILPCVHRKTIRLIGTFGSLAWLQTVSAQVFNQLDRIVVGLILGPGAIAVYGICVQAAQPIHALTSAALHAFFPYLSAQAANASPTALRSTIRGAFLVNLTISFALTIPLLLCAHRILSVWIGAAFAAEAGSLLSILALGYGFLSLNVTAHYSLLAFASIRSVALLNAIGAAAALCLITPLGKHFSLSGIACARLIYGPVTWGLYLTLYKTLRPGYVSDSPFAPLATLERP